MSSFWLPAVSSAVSSPTAPPPAHSTLPVRNPVCSESTWGHTLGEDQSPAQASTSPGHLKVQPTWASIKLPDSVEYGANQVLSCYCCLWFTGNEAAALEFPPRRQEIKLINSAKRWKIPHGKRGWGWECCVCEYICVCVDTCVHACVCCRFTDQHGAPREI